MPQHQNNRFQTGRADRHAYHDRAQATVSAGLSQNANFPPEKLTSNTHSHTHDEPLTPTQALKDILLILMDKYPPLRTNEMVKAINHIRGTFINLNTLDARNRFSVGTDRDLALSIEEVISQTRWTTKEHNYLQTLINALWHGTYPQSYGGGLGHAVDQPTTNRQSLWVQSTPQPNNVAGPHQPKVHNQSHVGGAAHSNFRPQHREERPELSHKQLRGPQHGQHHEQHLESPHDYHPEPLHSHHPERRHEAPRNPYRYTLRENHDESCPDANLPYAQTTIAHTTSRNALGYHAISSARPYRRYGASPTIQTEPSLPGRTHSCASSALSEYDRWQATDERYISPRDPLYQHEERTFGQRLKLNLSSLKESLKEVLQFWKKKHTKE